MDRPAAKAIAPLTEVGFRDNVWASDLEFVRRIVTSTGMFHEGEINIAVELVQEALQRGAAAGYYFVFAENAQGTSIGYACYGPIPCTLDSFDIYWIAVEPSRQRTGLGRRLMQEVERRVASRGGRQIFIDTSGRAAYLPTRNFYASCGFEVAAEFADFYALNDAKVVYRKRLPPFSSD